MTYAKGRHLNNDINKKKKKKKKKMMMMMKKKNYNNNNNNNKSQMSPSGLAIVERVRVPCLYITNMQCCLY